MRSIQYYKCDYCGKEFMTRDACEEHELSHIDTYSNLTNEQLADKMEELSNISQDHSICGTVFNMPVGSFQNLMEKVASRLRGECDE